MRADRPAPSGSRRAAPAARRCAAVAWAALAAVACGDRRPPAPPAAPASPAPADVPLAPAGDGPAAPLVVVVTGRAYRWHLRYPGPDGRPGTDDDRRAERDVHVPAHARVTLLLHSDDFVYTLRLPHAGLAEIAVPDLEFALSFDTGPPAVHPLKGEQMCGVMHPGLMGSLVVEPERDFRRWLAAAAPREAGR